MGFDNIKVIGPEEIPILVWGRRNKAGQKIKIFDFFTVHLGKCAAHTYKSGKEKRS